MKINISKAKRRIPTVNDVHIGDLFIMLDDGELYFKAFDGVYSVRDGKPRMLGNKNVRLVHSIDLVVDDFPKNM